MGSKLAGPPGKFRDGRHPHQGVQSINQLAWSWIIHARFQTSPSSASSRKKWCKLSVRFEFEFLTRLTPNPHLDHTPLWPSKPLFARIPKIRQKMEGSLAICRFPNDRSPKVGGSLAARYPTAPPLTLEKPGWAVEKRRRPFEPVS